MARKYPQVTFSDSVKERQEHFGSRESGKQVEAWEMDDEQLSANELMFITERDSFYMATVNNDGWPYVQYRGGPKGFLKAIDTRTLAYADYHGNRQFISMGNLRENDKVSLFFMDYPGRRRLKVLATTEVFDALDRPDLLERVQDSGYPGKVERVVVFHLVAFDWNCPQHITPRYTDEELAAMS
ncbi:MAG: putative pyridoxine 5'-phosphate oxidase superfamily flavin-nucleotide-binding protein [Planctomycetota bacterium]|jgi:predicted pyridoxine 5'-phosphate oxidase superfamily flavin-nucleotide-binding protein